jgi:hypothetical protein
MTHIHISPVALSMLITLTHVALCPCWLAAVQAYIIFSIGLIKPLQKALFPTCFVTHTDCAENLTHVQNYVQICGIIAGGWAQHRSAGSAALVGWSTHHNLLSLTPCIDPVLMVSDDTAHIQQALSLIMQLLALHSSNTPPVRPAHATPTPILTLRPTIRHPPHPSPNHAPGMLFFGALGDVIGRRMGSRVVATIMLSGSVLLVFTPLVAVPATYLSVYIFAATW